MKIKKSILFPIIISVYFIIMAAVYGKDLLATGRATQFYATCAAEVAVIVLMAVFLRKRERIDRDR